MADSNTSNSTLTTNFNVSPYYDDYDPTKNFYRIIFKPGFAVQARELSQIQTMLQTQISRFGKHVFKEGSIVLPGAFSLRTNIGTEKGNPVNYVKIKDVNNANTIINASDFIGQRIVGQSSNIAALVVDALPSDGTSANTNTLYITYLNASEANSQIRVFQSNELLVSGNVGTAIVANTDPTGYAAWFQIESGVFFAKDHFIYFPTQSVVLDRYSANPTCKVGFYVSEEIINYTQDISLLDPALESSNYSAPGADRLRLVSDLSVVGYDEDTGEDFVTLFTIRDGVIQTSNERSEYSILGDTLASRTFDESGDYVVRGLNVQISEHDRVSSPFPNYGRYETGNNDLLVVTVDPGTSYVHGYSVINYDRKDIDIAKPKDFRNVASQVSSTSQGQYLRVNEFVGSWILDRSNRVNFFDVPQRRVTNNGLSTGGKWSTGVQSGNNIGSGIINSVQYVGGVPGYDAQYNIYLSDIRMTGANSVSNIRSLYFDNSSVADMGADVFGSSNTSSNTSFQEINNATLLYYVGDNAVRSVRGIDGSPQVTYYFNKTDGVSHGLSIGAGGVATVTLTGPSNEILPYGTSTLSDTDVSQDIIMTIGQSFNIALPGTVTASGTSLTGIGTTFSRLNVGDKLEFAGHANTVYVTAITSNTAATVSTALPGTVSSSAFFKAYKNGDIVNLTGRGVAAGAKRTVQATPTSLTIDLKETFPTDIPATVTYKVASTLSAEATKTLRPNRYVVINCATAGTNGPFNLGLSDVYRIRNVIRKSGGIPSNLADGTNVTQYFTLDNGQRDTMYDLARLVKKQSFALDSTDRLLVELDYFVPNFSGRAGFFTINSYPVEDNDANSSNSTIRTEGIPVYTSPLSSLTYDLRNHIDFRPVKTITANDSTTVAGATVNPSNVSTSYSFTGSGMKFPVPSNELSYDYSYYIGRKDIVVVNKDATFTVTTGIPSENPIAPEALDSQMLLAILNIAPYPSLSPAYANRLGRKDLAVSAKKVSNRRYTMRDIGVLDNRIKNLEYYTTLTLLEKDALNLKILDENGLDRFKNGIFVDTFRDDSLSAKGIDRDYRIVTDPVELCIRPLFSTESLGYDFLSTTSGSVAVNGSIITMAYSEEEIFDQPRVTDSRNLERGTFYFRGTMSCFPDQDVWVDTSFAPDEVVTVSTNNTLLDVNVSGPDAVNQVAAITKSLINTVWEGWKATITGYNLYRGQGATRTFVGTFATEAAARQAASAWTTIQNGGAATLETVYNNTRLGTNYFANESTDQGAGSNKLISSEIIPYIRPQTLTLKAQNMKAYSKLNVFFDGVRMSQYVTPLTEAQFNLAIARQPIPVGTLATEGSDLIVPSTGTVYFNLRLPADAPRFRTGERNIVIMDGEQLAPETIEAETDASTVAVATFFADGKKQTLQRTVYSTRGYQKTSEETSEAYRSTNDLILPNTWTPPPPRKNHCCFDPNARVLMADGSYKAIKDIKEGDKVIGKDWAVNTVLKNKTIGVGTRKMLKFKSYDFYTTDDHLFATDKGWKTWRPDIVLSAPDTCNAIFLKGMNKHTPINDDDKLIMIADSEDNYIEVGMPYKELEAEYHEFDPDFVVHDLTLNGNFTYIVEGFLVHNCCVAYNVLFRVPQDEEGLFTTGYNVYVQRKSATRGLWFELREVDNAGNITDVQIPGTEVHLSNAQVLESTNGIDNPTQVRFPAPVFLMNNKEYAFVIHSDSPDAGNIDPDTAIWISRLGEFDRNTGAKINERQKAGNFFQTTNNRKWDLIPDIDLRIEILRAKFNTGTASFIIGNRPVEKLLLANVSSSMVGQVGSYFITGDRLTLASANGTISVGDRVTGNVSTGNANGTVISVLGGGQFLVSNTRYRIGEKVDIRHASNNNYKGVSATVTAVSNTTAQLSYYDESSANIYAEFRNSTGGFTTNTVIQSMVNSGYDYRGEVSYVGDYRYSSVSVEPKVLDFVKTDIGYEMATYANNSTTDSGFEVIYPSETYYFREEKSLYSRTNEILNLGGGRSNRLRVTFNSTSEYVSPVLDLDSTHTIYIDNIINANTSGEDGVSGGQAYNKYISQTITLAEDQDAEDLNVFLTAYRPPGTDVKVYVKLLHVDDGDTLAQKNWIEMPKIGDGDVTFSSISNRFNFRDFKYELPASMMTGPNGEARYTSNGITFTGFKYFTIKIVLVADNSAIVPRVADLRCIALQL